LLLLLALTLNNINAHKVEKAACASPWQVCLRDRIKRRSKVDQLKSW